MPILAAHQPKLTPLWRNALRLWLAATLAVGIMLWSGESRQLGWALILAVLFINENDSAPLHTIGTLLTAAMVGILTALVLHHLATGWLMLAIGLLITGLLVRRLGLTQGLSMGYLMSWAIATTPADARFSWALPFHLAFAVVVGILSAQIATWLFWPRSPLRQLPALECGLATRLEDQIQQVQHWLLQGGAPPRSLHSQQLLPEIQQLQQWRRSSHGTGLARGVQRLMRRWAQAGDLWRQVLRQWLLLEPLLLQLPAPLPCPRQQSLLQRQLDTLRARLQPGAAATAALTPVATPELWLEQADQLRVSRPLLLALAAQSRELEQLLRSRALLRAGIEALLAPGP